VKSTWLRVSHNIVATKEKRKRLGLLSNDKCAARGEKDTLQHRLSQCGAARSITPWVIHIVNQIYSNKNKIGMNHLLYFDLHELRPPEKKNACIWLLGQTVHCLIGRNK
jgi:hypothetical protein